MDDFNNINNNKPAVTTSINRTLSLFLAFKSKKTVYFHCINDLNCYFSIFHVENRRIC